MTAQLENGYTKLANEILDQIARTKFNGTQFRIIMAVFRYTYGFNRKEHEMSISFISEVTGIHKRQIQRELINLIDAKIILVIKESSFSSPATLAFNKYFDQWRPKSLETAKKTSGSEKDVQTDGELVVSSDGELDVRGDGELVVQEINNKNKSKENLKEIYSHQFEEFWRIYPRKKEKPRAFKAWQARIRNKASPEDIIKAARSYADECKRDGTEMKYIKHAATFIGPSEPYKDYLNDDVINSERGKVVEAGDKFLRRGSSFCDI